MANRFPLIANSSANQIQEIAAADNLDLTSSAIVSATSIGSTFLNVPSSNGVGVVTFNHTFINGQSNFAGIATFSGPTFVSGGATFTGIVTFSAASGMGNVTVGGTFTASGITSFKDVRLGSIAEKNSVTSGSSVTINYTAGNGNVVYMSSASGNVALAITNVPTDSTFNERAMTFSVIINQGATAYIVNSISVNGTGLTINWANSVTPTANASKKDIFSFSLINTSGSAASVNNYMVLGSLVGNFG